MTTVLESLNDALHDLMARDPAVYLLGEDVLDPYGGAFKVTRGLSSAFPDRTLTTPVSEAGITGVAAGMALRGLRPIVEIMFGDFLSLTADQLINHAAKARWMYGVEEPVSLVIRTPMGGRRGYGPTHSQSLEKHFLGVPGLTVLAPTALGDPGALLQSALRAPDPVLFIENKRLYSQPLLGPEDLPDFRISVIEEEDPQATPTYSLTLRDAPPPALTLCAYGHMAELAREAVLELAYEHEIISELIVPTQLAPVRVAPLLAACRRTRRLVVAEEGTLSYGWGAEVLARAATDADGIAASRVAALDSPLPASPPLERAVLPQVETIVAAARALIADTR